MKATPEDVAKPHFRRGPHLRNDASMKATPEDVAKGVMPVCGDPIGFEPQ